MRPNADDPDIYEHNNILNTFPNDWILYKYVYATSNGIVWESGSNRTYTVTSDDITNGSVYVWGSQFSLICCVPQIGSPFDVKFTINMNGAVSAINQQPFTSVTDVRIGRKFNDEWCFMYPGPDCFPSPGWPDEDSLKTTKLYDDGTNGDLVAGDNIWSKDIHFPWLSRAKIEYMYSANWGLPTNNGGNQNESTLRKHRVHFPINISSATVVDTFGRMGEHPLTNLVIVDIETEPPSIVNSYSLQQNYPNPFNPSTKIRFTITNNAETRHGVSLRVYDILGNEVATLVDEYKSGGNYEIEFSAANSLSSGIYFYQLRAGDFVATKKMIFLK